MNLLPALKMECYKLARRNSTKLLGIFVLLPLFYGIANLKNSSAVTIEGQFSAVTFASMCWALLGLTGITNILFVILIAAYFGKEQEEGQLKFLLLKLCERKKVFMTKSISVLVLIVSSYILMYIISTIVYFTCIAGASHGAMLIEDMEDLLICFSTDFLYLIQLAMVCCIEIFLCMYFKSSFSLLLGIAISIIFIVLQYVPIVKFADPIYIVNLYNESQISTLVVAVYGILYLLFSYGVLCLAKRKFLWTEMK